MKTFPNRYCNLVILAALIAVSAGCDLRKPIKVGFSGQLTGPHGNMGVSGRDGVLLAIEKINAEGGVAGKKIELVVRDDKGTQEGARTADRELIETGVVAIIGHMTSGQTMAALPVSQKAGMVLLSPTTSTPQLTGKIDNFFRVIADSASEARMLARHTMKTIGLDRVAAIYDSDNDAYTKSYLEAFSDEIHKLGGQVVGEASFSSSRRLPFAPLISQIRDTDPQGLLIIASAYDSALIAQRTRTAGWQTHLLGSGWAKSAPLIENGGRAVEGMEFIQDHDPNCQSTGCLKFNKLYSERFRQAPTFMANDAYEAMFVLAAALQQTGGRSEGLTGVLPGISIQGVMQTVSLDRYGDGVRDRYRIVVQDGRFVTKGRAKQ